MARVELSLVIPVFNEEPVIPTLAARLRAFLAEVASVCTIVGAEITAAAPDHGEMIVDAITPLLA